MGSAGRLYFVYGLVSPVVVQKFVYIFLGLNLQFYLYWAIFWCAFYAVRWIWFSIQHNYFFLQKLSFVVKTAKYFAPQGRKLCERWWGCFCQQTFVSMYSCSKETRKEPLQEQPDIGNSILNAMISVMWKVLIDLLCKLFLLNLVSLKHLFLAAVLLQELSDE